MRPYGSMNWALLTNSLMVSAGTAILAALAGAMVAVCAAGWPARVRHALLAGAATVLALPPFLVTNCWLDLLGNSGLLHDWLPLKIYSLPGTIWILTLMTWPLSFLAASAALRRLVPEHLEVEPQLRGVRLLSWILWPMVRPTLGAAFLLTFVLALNNVSVPALLQVKVLSSEVWLEFSARLDNLSAIKIGWPLLVAPLLLLWVMSRREIVWPREQLTVPPLLFRQRIGRGIFLVAAILCAALYLVSLIIPLAQLLGNHRMWPHLWPALQSGGPALANSFWLAALCATSVVVLGGLAHWPGRNRNPFNQVTARSGTALGIRRLASAAVWMCFFVPGVLLGVALIYIFNQPVLEAVYRSGWIMLLALVIRYAAPAWQGTGLAMNALDGTLCDAARIEGARGWTLFHLAIWPQAGPRLAAAWYVVYLLCLWDVETLVLIIPPGGETVSLRVFNLLHYGHSPLVNALCLWLLALAVLPLAVWLAWTRLVKLPRAVYLVLPWVTLLLGGCQPAASDREASIPSQFFSKAVIIGRRGTAPGEFNKPRSVVVDRRDNLYVVDMTGRVQKFSPDGVFLLSWQMPETDLGKAKGLGLDKDGNIIVVEPHYQRLNHFTPQGKLLAQWGRHGTEPGDFTLPRAVGVSSRGDFVVSEYTQADRVQVFDAVTKKYLRGWGAAGEQPGYFNRAEGLCLDAQNRIYVADSCNHRVQIFDLNGKWLRAYGRAGAGLGELSYPYDIRVDAAGYQYVCEFGNSRIQIFNALDRPVEILGGPGTRPGQFNNPWGIALDSQGNLYVADALNHRVQKLIRRRTVVWWKPDGIHENAGWDNATGPYPLTSFLSLGERMPVLRLRESAQKFHATYQSFRESVHHASADQAPLEFLNRRLRDSLSQRERARVRGYAATNSQATFKVVRIPRQPGKWAPPA